MRKKKDLNKNNTTKFALVFIAIVVFIIVISLIVKTVFIIKQSKFDDSKRINISIYDNKNSKVISIAGYERAIGVLNIEQKIDQSQISRYLGIPIDAFIKAEGFDINQETDSLFLNSLFHFSQLKTNLTIIDLARLFIFAKITPKRETSMERISKDLTLENIDNIVGKLLKDDKIEKEKQTVRIINATDVAGLGNRLARFITNMGANVIIVTTSDMTQKDSTISYESKKTFTVEKLTEVLGFKTTEATGKNIADITITIGEDKVSHLPF